MALCREIAILSLRDTIDDVRTVSTVFTLKYVLTSHFSIPPGREHFIFTEEHLKTVVSPNFVKTLMYHKSITTMMPLSNTLVCFIHIFSSCKLLTRL